MGGLHFPFPCFYFLSRDWRHCLGVWKVKNPRGECTEGCKYLNNHPQVKRVHYLFKYSNCIRAAGVYKKYFPKWRSATIYFPLIACVFYFSKIFKFYYGDSTYQSRICFFLNIHCAFKTIPNNGIITINIKSCLIIRNSLIKSRKKYEHHASQLYLLHWLKMNPYRPDTQLLMTIWIHF